MRVRQPVAIALAALGLLIAATADAQVGPLVPLPGRPDSTPVAGATGSLPPVPSFATLFTSLGSDLKHLASRDSLLIAGAGFAGAATTHAWDGSRASRPATISPLFAPGQIAGSFAAQAGGGLATYLVGRATHRPGVAQLGSELVRAQFLIQTLTQVTKLTAGRTRPDGTAGSLPSGHAAGSFATATVLQAHYGWKVGLPAYAAATWIAASRVQAQRHYLSDVVAGATVGILAGRSVTLGSRSTKFALGPMAVPGGVGIGLTRIEKR